MSKLLSYLISYIFILYIIVNGACRCIMSLYLLGIVIYDNLLKVSHCKNILSCYMYIINVRFYVYS